MPPVIRPYRPEDQAATLAVCVAALEPVHEGFRAALGEAIFARHYGRWREDYAAFFAGFPPEDPRRGLFVAELDGRLASFTSITVDTTAGVGEIGLTAVDPAVQRRGVCRALLAVALDELRVRGAKAASVGAGGDAAHASARAA
jgi:ribosomal protein S18 acetylase RimI-like enzyme